MKYLFYILILIALTGVFNEKNVAQATTTADPYVLLAPLPCEAGTPGCDPATKTLKSFDPTTGLGTYLNLMIKIFIGLCAVLSVVMIVMGGVEYMTSELAHTKESGKEKIEHAILGLIIALGAWALLYTINPDLLKSDFNPPSATVTLPANGTCKLQRTQNNETKDETWNNISEQTCDGIVATSSDSIKITKISWTKNPN